MRSHFIKIVSSILLAGVVISIPVSSQGDVVQAVASQDTLAFVMSPVVLRTNIVVDSDKIKLSDVFSGILPEQDRIISPAPAPGRRIRFTAALLQRMARAYNIDWQPLDRRETTTVSRASHEIDARQIKEFITPHLLQKLGGENIDIRLDVPDMTIHFPTQDTSTATKELLTRLTVRSTDFNNRTGRFKVEVLVDMGKRSKPIHFTGRAIEQVSLPTLRRNFRRGDIVEANDIVITKIVRSRTPATPLENTSNIIGKQAKRNIMAGKPLVEADLRNPVVIKRGQFVTMAYRTNLMTLSTRGQVMHDAGVGDVVRVRNVASDTLVQAQVTSEHEVIVVSKAPLLTELQ